MNVLQSELIIKICRLCLTQSNCCIRMDSKWGETMRLRIMINNLLPFQISEHDGCSRYICWDCCMHVQLLNTFVEKCVQRNMTLKGAAGDSCSQPSQGCNSVSMPGSADGSACHWDEQQYSDWLSQSFENEAKHTPGSGSVHAENTDGSVQVEKKKLKRTICKEKSFKTKKIACANKENRCKVTAVLQPRKPQEGPRHPLDRKVGRLDGSPCKYNLRQSTRRSDRDARCRASKTGQGSSWQTNRPSEPLLIFSHNATQESDEDALSGKTSSELSVLSGKDKHLAMKEKDHGGHSGQQHHCDSLLQNSHASDSFGMELKSLLDCPHFPRHPVGVNGDHQESKQKTKPNANFLGGKNFLGIQPQYPHDEDLSAQFARRHVSFLSW